MEIKELSFMENLSDNDKETSAKDSVTGGHSYGYDLHGYFSHPLLDKLKDLDFGNITIELIQPEPEPELEISSISTALTNTGLLSER